MNRSELKAISRLRVEEAKTLLDSGYYSGAFYLLGYSVECALKACIAKQIQRHDFPEKKFIDDCYTHNLVALVRLAGLGPDLDSDSNTYPALEINWTIVKDWSEKSRYSTSIPAQQARDFYSAVTQRRHGVLVWLKRRW